MLLHLEKVLLRMGSDLRGVSGQHGDHARTCFTLFVPMNSSIFFHSRLYLEAGRAQDAPAIGTRDVQLDGIEEALVLLCRPVFSNLCNGVAFPRPSALAKV